MAAKALWGGRFKKEIHPKLKAFSYSLVSDRHLLDAELAVNEAYVKMLARIGLVSRTEKDRILSGLRKIRRDFAGKDLSPLSGQYEDIHTLIQVQLEKTAGPAAKKIHTGRSRNDLVATSTRVYLREKIQCLDQCLREFELSLVECAERAGDAVIPGLTHLKKAMPVLLSHHLLAYVEMLEEDRERFRDNRKRVNVLGLGSGSLAGSTLPLDREFLARELKFEKISSNSMAAVSDRAWLTEFMSGLAILWVHLSRLAEDFILWNSEAFGYIELDDAFATGSSLMPQKKNPDVFELIRGRSGTIFGQLQSLLVMQKGLALAYNRDLQEDKPPVFEAISKTESALELLTLTLRSVTFNRNKIREAVLEDDLFATDLLEYLVLRKVPFSEAHQKVGRLVREAKEKSIPLRDVPLGTLKRYAKEFDQEVYDLFDAATSVKAKQTYGSTQPEKVKREIAKWSRKLKG